MSGPGGDGSAEALVAKAARGIASGEYALATSAKTTKHCGSPQCALPLPPREKFAPKTALSGRVFAALKAINGVVEKIKTCGECVTVAAPTHTTG